MIIPPNSLNLPSRKGELAVDEMNSGAIAIDGIKGDSNIILNKKAINFANSIN